MAGLKYGAEFINYGNQAEDLSKFEALSHHSDVEFLTDVFSQKAPTDLVTPAVIAHHVVPIAVDALAVRFPPTDPTHAFHDLPPDALIDPGKTARVQ